MESRGKPFIILPDYVPCTVPLDDLTREQRNALINKPEVRVDYYKMTLTAPRGVLDNVFNTHPIAPKIDTNGTLGYNHIEEAAEAPAFACHLCNAISTRVFTIADYKFCSAECQQWFRNKVTPSWAIPAWFKTTCYGMIASGMGLGLAALAKYLLGGG